MKRPKPYEHRISQINTHWSEIFQAHGGLEGNGEVVEAQRKVLERYTDSIYRYLLGATRDPDCAEELAQEFAFRFVRGDFRHADPSKGRFRDYLKKSLSHLVSDHFRNQLKKGITLNEDIQEANDDEDDFTELWRRQLIAYAWESLKTLEQKKSNHYYTVLKFRAEHPDLNSTEIASAISAKINEPVTSDWVRQKLHRARQKFSKFLIEEVRKTMPVDPDAEIDSELAELDLLKYLES